MSPAFMLMNFPENPKYGHQRFACIQAPNDQEALRRLYASAKRGARFTRFVAHPMQPLSHHIARGLNRRRPTSNLFWQNNAAAHFDLASLPQKYAAVLQKPMLRRDLAGQPAAKVRRSAVKTNAEACIACVA